MKKKYITPKIIVVKIRKMQLLANSGSRMTVKIKDELNEEFLLDLGYGGVNDNDDLDPE